MLEQWGNRNMSQLFTMAARAKFESDFKIHFSWYKHFFKTKFQTNLFVKIHYISFGLNLICSKSGGSL